MKNFYLLLVFLLILKVPVLGQKADVKCGSLYPKLDYGFVNYNDNDLGRIFKITYKTNLMGNRAIITSIDVMGNVPVAPTNITTSNIADSIISIIGSSSAVKISLSAIPASTLSSVTANILSNVINNLSVLMVGKTEMSINNINDLKPLIVKQNLPNLNGKGKMVYAICNQVQRANKLLVGLKKGNSFSMDLTVDVPQTIDASGKLSVNISCTDLANFKGKDKLAFYNFIPIDYQGSILNGFMNKSISEIDMKGINTDVIMDKNGNIYKKDKSSTESKNIVFVDKLPFDELPKK